MKGILAKLKTADKIYRHLFGLITAVYFMNFAILFYYATGSVLMKRTGEWYWPYEFFLYSPVYCFFASVAIGIFAYWNLADSLRHDGRTKKGKIDTNCLGRWMVYSGALFSIGIVYFSIYFWVL